MQIHPNATHLLIRHQEIALKGANRIHFERRLINHANKVIEAYAELVSNVKKQDDRLLIELGSGVTSEHLVELEKLVSQLATIGGVTAITPCNQVEQNFDAIFNTARTWLAKHADQDSQIQTFRIRSRRTDKTFKISSRELDLRIGSALANAFPNIKPKLKNADLEICIEIRKKYALIYSDEVAGAKGVPVDTKQRVAVLLSGGIDSPVAAYQIMRRGCLPVFIHFHSKPFTSEASLEKAKKLVQTLRNHSTSPLELWLVPLLEIQQAVCKNSNPRNRTIHYRRFMIRIAQEIAIKTRAQALVTGDVIGQVASQTLANIAAIDSVSQVPILRPLISFDKQDIIAQARKLSTYEISLLPHDDTCSLFAPEKPSTQANQTALAIEDGRLPIFELVFRAIDTAEKVVI